MVLCGFPGETKPELEKLVDAAEWVRVGQLSKPIKFFRREGAAEAVMMGQISPKNLFELRTDLRALMMFARLKQRNAETIFGAIADELAKDGITVLPATTFLEDHLPGPGHVCGPAFKKRQLADADFGFRIAKQLSTSARAWWCATAPCLPPRPLKGPTRASGVVANSGGARMFC